ncbi:hypothetical protein P643_3112, partial [Acinetobacter baumannii UH10007]
CFTSVLFTTGLTVLVVGLDLEVVLATGLYVVVAEGLEGV